MLFLPLGLGNRDFSLGAVPFGIDAQELGPGIFLTFLRFHAPVIGMHGAMQGDGRFARLVDCGKRVDELGILLVSEAMVPYDEITVVSPAFLTQVLLALFLVHLEEDIPLDGYALANAFTDNVPLVLVIVAATSGNDKTLEWFANCS